MTALRTDRGHHVAGQHDAVGVKADPDVPTPSRKPVLGDSLGQQRCLAQAGSAHHGRHPVLPTADERAQQPRSGEASRAAARGHKPERARYVDRHPKSVAPARLANRTPRLASRPLIHSGHPAFQQAFTFTDTECGAPITIGYVAEFSGPFMRKQGGWGIRHPISLTIVRASDPRFF